MISSLKPHWAYKDSAAEWLGSVPKHWAIEPGRVLFREIINRGYPNEQLLSVTINRGVILQSELISQTSKKDSSNEDKSAYKLVEPGDLVYNKMRAWQGAVGVSTHRGLVSPAYIVQRLRDPKDLPRYFHYLLRTPHFAKEAERWSYGITSDQWSLRGEDFKRIVFPHPPTNEQRAIVRFLDWAERRIRGIIAARRKRIQLLEEYRQMLINDAVTGKFDVRTGKPYPAYKDSGVAWLGKVPEGWEVKKLRQVTRLIVSNVDKKSSKSEVPVRLCNYVDVYNHEVISENLPFMQATATKEEIRKFAVKRGDVVITKDSEIWNDIGVPAYVDCEAPDLIYGYHLAILRPLANALQGKYLFRTLQSQPVATQLHIEATGVTRFGLYQQAIKSVQIPLPPLSEQRAIAEYLDRETKKIDAAIEKTKKSIELWEELRTTLIADVVTGKLDVREVAEKLPEEEPELEAKIEALEASLKENGRETEAEEPEAEPAEEPA